MLRHAQDGGGPFAAPRPLAEGAAAPAPAEEPAQGGGTDLPGGAYGGVPVEEYASVLSHWAADGPPAPPAERPAWVADAEAHNRQNVAYVVAFDRATGGAYAKRNGELDAERVAGWQADHGLPRTGKVDQDTVAMAQGRGRGGPRAMDPEVRRLGARLARLQPEALKGPIAGEHGSIIGEISARVRAWREYDQDFVAASLLLGRYAGTPEEDHADVAELRRQFLRTSGSHPDWVEVQTERCEMRADASGVMLAAEDEQPMIMKIYWQYYGAAHHGPDRAGQARFR
jgi:hypothetical protein